MSSETQLADPAVIGMPLPEPKRRLAIILTVVTMVVGLVLCSFTGFIGLLGGELVIPWVGLGFAAFVVVNLIIQAFLIRKRNFQWSQDRGYGSYATFSSYQQVVNVALGALLLALLGLYLWGSAVDPNYLNLATDSSTNLPKFFFSSLWVFLLLFGFSLVAIGTGITYYVGGLLTAEYYAVKRREGSYKFILTARIFNLLVIAAYVTVAIIEITTLDPSHTSLRLL